jgi:hypothetical protein
MRHSSAEAIGSSRSQLPNASDTWGLISAYAPPYRVLGPAVDDRPGELHDGAGRSRKQKQNLPAEPVEGEFEADRRERCEEGRKLGGNLWRDGPRRHEGVHKRDVGRARATLPGR